MTERDDTKPLIHLPVRHRCGYEVIWVLILEGTTEDEMRESLELSACLVCQARARQRLKRKGVFSGERQ